MKGKMEMETLGRLILLIAFLVIAMLVIGVFFQGFKETGMKPGEATQDYLCWGTNLLKTKVSSLFPGTCREQIVDEAVDFEVFAQLMRRCWWMYGKSEWNLGVKEGGLIKKTIEKPLPFDYSYTCYAFFVKETSEVDEKEATVFNLMDYLETHSKGDRVEDHKKSDLYFLEKTKGENICFDEDYFRKTDGKFEKDTVYYIRFLDDIRIGKGGEDMLLISNKNDFEDRDCYDYTEAEKIEPLPEEFREPIPGVL